MLVRSTNLSALLGLALVFLSLGGVQSSGAPSSNAKLASLRLYADGPRVSGRDLNTLVNPNIKGTITAAADYTRLFAVPVAQDTKAQVTVNGALTASGAYSAPMPMTMGSNPVTVIVTAEDGVTTQTYTVSVTRGRFKMWAQRSTKVPPPGITDGATIRQFNDVSLNNSDGVAYTAQLLGGKGGLAADGAAWSTGILNSTPVLVLRSGAIGTGGVFIVGRDLVFPRLSDDGRGSLFSPVLGKGPIRAMQWVDDGYDALYAAAYQTTVFEAPASYRAFTGFSYTTQQPTKGLTCFASNLVQGGKGEARVTSLNDSGLWKINPNGGVTTAAAREGERLPSTVGRGLVQGEVMRAAIGTLDYAVYTGYVQGTGVTSANALVILQRELVAKAAPVLVARTGTQVAALPKGVKYYNFLGEGGHSPAVTFWAQLTGPGVTPENHRALFQGGYPDRGLPIRLLLRDDDDLSSYFGAGVKFRSVQTFWTLANGTVVLQGQLKGIGITAANDVFVAKLGNTPGTMAVIAREGDVVTAAGNSAIDTIQQVDVSLFGHTALLCSLVNGTGDTADNLNNQVLLRRNVFLADVLEPVIRKGTPPAGGRSPVYSIQMTKNVVQGNTGSTTGMSRAVNDNGKVAVIVTTMDNNQGVFVGP